MNFHLLQSSDLRMLSEVLLSLHQPVENKDFGDHALKVLNQFFPESLAIYGRLDLLLGVTERLVRIEGHTPDSSLSKSVCVGLAKFYTQHPMVAAAKSNPIDQVLRLSDLTTFRKFSSTDLYQEVLRQFHVRDQVMMVLNCGRRCLIGFTLGVPGSPNISDGLLGVMQLLQGHFTLAHANTALLSRYKSRFSDVPLPALAKMATNRISVRELEVLKWMSAGKRDAEIGQILGVSRRTVESHVSKVLRKLGVESRTAAVATLLG